ncbi:glycosyltransferase family 4 protein [Noviherbaspirillum cavernae]|uniref:Glycosyltransferase family 4 protein n=1 Tax=Noviherbaspirillum cavernae TaxID=2320862 RepID=A0A418X481_9BURK|nr:glycosyltransferase family 4 protein [Noviherbaspirillum cavernae]RJG07226.1 glycosyltransferase family 4 protein [Noviherbaspirillum cavernae]
MKIAQFSPLFERVPPKAYGGTERIISYLTEELVRRGHEVTLFATGDSSTDARLVSAVDQPLRQEVGRQSWLAYYAMQLDQLAQMAHSFDVIHFHTEYMHFPLARMLGVPHVTTVHGRLDLPELMPLYKRFNDCPLVSISNSQRNPLPAANWCDTIYHGLPSDMYAFMPTGGDYFAFVGRVSPEKRLDRAIEIARACGMRLYIAAKIDQMDEPYFNSEIKPLLRDPLVEYIGEVGDREKRELLEHASALLFPVDWPEPFGLVMIEAFACGTPVIAYRNGSIPEIMEDGVTGFVVTDQEAAIRAAQNIAAIDRRHCRDTFERRFTVATMAENYLRIYQQILDSDAPSFP